MKRPEARLAFPAGMPPEWRGYNQTQISCHPPKQGPEGLAEPESLLDCVNASTLFRLRYEYVPTLTITALHERIRSPHVDHFGPLRDPECLLSCRLPDQSPFGRFKPAGFGDIQHAQFAPAQKSPVHKDDVALMPPALFHACYAMQCRNWACILWKTPAGHSIPDAVTLI